MKNVWIALSLALVSSSAFAAKFTDISVMKNAKIRTVQAIANSIFESEFYGDASGTVSVKYTKKESEKLLNSLKQFNVARMGVWQDDGEVTSASTFKNAGEIIAFLMEDHGDELIEMLDDEADKNTYRMDMKKLGGALKGVIGVDGIEMFDSGHCNEDGCWAVLNIVDTKNQQIMTIRRGFTGT